jgi:DNA-directed RNA polymerase subunit alpha
MFQRNWKQLIKPRRIEVQTDTATFNYGKFVAEPLERGFGTTLGNALRRILLSSLQGGAITSVRIEGVQHEFSTMVGVVEDVTDIVLNLKEIRLRMHSPEQRTLILEAKGPCRVKASDISPDPMVEILNRDHHIAELSDNAVLKMELAVRMGKGYVSAERNLEENSPIGTIPIDAIFSPLRKVNFTVTNARVGQQTDYDRLTLEVWTDGSLLPADAVAYAAKILKDQLTVFINFDDEAEMPDEPLRLDDAGHADEAGGRAGALGAGVQLPEERRHKVHRGARAAVGAGDAEDEELRQEEPERDQGGPRRHGALPRDESGWVHAGQVQPAQGRGLTN